MRMKLVKKGTDYSIYRRGDNRYAVKGADGKPVNAEEKVRILVAEDLVKVAVPAAPAAEEAPETAAESAEEAPEAASEESDKESE